MLIQILLITIYSKSDKSDVPAAEIRDLIKRAEAASKTQEDLAEDLEEIQ